MTKKKRFLLVSSAAFVGIGAFYLFLFHHEPALPTPTRDGLANTTGHLPSAGDTGTTTGIGPGVFNPKVIHQVPPTYPPAARERKLSGKVVVRVTVLGNGDVARAEVESSTEALFNEAALQAVKQFKYEPIPLENRERVSFYVYATINFQPE